MGHVYVDGLLEGSKGKKKISMFVDTGSTFTMMPYKLAEELGIFRTHLTEKVTLADRRVAEYEVGFAYLEILERRTLAKILLGDFEEPIIGVETLETMGLRVDTVTGEVQPSRGWTARAPSGIRLKSP